MKIKEYPIYNNSDSGRTDEQKEAVIKFANELNKSCLKCAHFTTASQIDNGKCHVHYNRHDVHDVCEQFETREEWAKRFWSK